MVIYAIPNPGSSFHKLSFCGLRIKVDIKEKREDKVNEGKYESEGTQEIFPVAMDKN